MRDSAYIGIVDQDEERRKHNDLGQTVTGQRYFHSNLTTDRTQSQWDHTRSYEDHTHSQCQRQDTVNINTAHSHTKTTHKVNVKTTQMGTG